MKNGSPRVKRMKQKAVRSKFHGNSDDALMENMAASFYKKVNPRKLQEIMDARMIQEDHHAIANLSPQFINRTFNPDKFCASYGRYDEMSDIGE